MHVRQAMSTRRRRGAALVLAVGLTATQGASLATPTAVAAPATATSGAPRVNWAPCYEKLDELIPWVSQGLECAQVPVPLDHDEPQGASILIRIIRVKATDPARRVGSLFVNPGGPGGSGVDMVVFGGDSAFSEDVRARYDIVGFDPRGIARSTQLLCGGGWQHLSDWFGVPGPWPEGAEQVEAWAAGDAEMQEDCATKHPRILDHMSTADVARDLDVLRASVGDAQLNFVGYSYGSLLGATYANLFPERVRRMVVDGVLDPVAWTTGAPGTQHQPFSTRLRSDEGAQATLDEFFRLCDEAGSDCPYAGPDGSAARFDAFQARLREHPMETPFGPYDDKILVAESLGWMYNSWDWWLYAYFLDRYEDGNFDNPFPWEDVTSRGHHGGAGRNGVPLFPGIEGFAGVACSDSDNPSDVNAWTTSAAERLAVSKYGPLWTWASSTCNAWPGSKEDRYAGPWTARTANPVLIANTRFDPATPVHGAERLASLLPNSRLLTVEGWGHTTPYLSQAADEAVAAYLIDGTLRDVGQVFRQDGDPMAPWDLPDGPGAGPGAGPGDGSTPPLSSQAEQRLRFERALHAELPAHLR